MDFSVITEKADVTFWFSDCSTEAVCTKRSFVSLLVNF